ncbi:MAG: MBL fold metallo-hydrolase [Nitrospinota bacterium]
MKIKFWGVRGSIPTPGPQTIRYGGNTPCIEVAGNDGTLVILDSGSGMRPLGETLATKAPLDIHLFLTHTHWDHIHGFPFFIPAYIPNNKIHIYGPSHFNKKLHEIMAHQMSYSYFPVRVDELKANITYRDLKEETLKIGNFEITSKLMNHPVTAFGYRVTEGERKLVYTGDHEPYYNFLGSDDDQSGDDVNLIIDEQNKGIRDFISPADVLIGDSHYLEEEYESKKGWGHSHIFQTLDLALSAKVKHLVLFHHDPARSDIEVDALTEAVIKRCQKLGKELKITPAKEGDEINL